MNTQIIKGNYDFKWKAKRRKTRKRWKRTNIRFFASFIFIHLIFCYHFFPAAKHQQSRNWDQTTTFKTKQMRLASSFYWKFRKLHFPPPLPEISRKYIFYDYHSGFPSNKTGNRSRSEHKPCLWPAPLSTVWHWAHLVLKIFSPVAALPAGASANVAILSDHNATSALEFSETIAVRFQNFRSPSNLGEGSGCGRDEMTRLSLGSLTLTALAARMRKRVYSLVGGVA